MSLALILAGGGILGMSGIPGLALSWRSAWGQRSATGLAVLGGALGIVGAARVLCGGGGASVSYSWSLPGAAWEMP